MDLTSEYRLLINYRELNKLLHQYKQDCITFDEAIEKGLRPTSKRQDLLEIVQYYCQRHDAEISAMKSEGTFF
jgi:hypothetical protein